MSFYFEPLTTFATTPGIAAGYGPPGGAMLKEKFTEGLDPSAKINVTFGVYEHLYKDNAGDHSTSSSFVIDTDLVANDGTPISFEFDATQAARIAQLAQEVVTRAREVDGPC